MSYRRFLYSVALYLLFPIVILRLLWRSRNNRAYRQRIPERLGFVSLSATKIAPVTSTTSATPTTPVTSVKAEQQRPVIWLHAVSVGETIAARPLIEALIHQYSDYRILVTSTTPTGSEMVKKLFADKVEHVYFPYDLPEIVARFLNRVKPELLLLVETEIWPNLYAACEKRQIPMMLANARLSQRSTKGYQKISGLVEETLRRLSLIAVRSEVDADHFRKLGATENQITVAGNIKFDLQLDKAQIEKGKSRKKQWGIERPVWVAASTHTGEDEQIVKIYASVLQKFPDLLLILIPRHMERFDEVYALCQKQTDITTLRHSQQSDYLDCAANIILGDTMGEMQSWFAAADVVFMGGSLVPTGGHNPLEATALSKPVLSGPHVFNFEDVFPLLTRTGLSWVCEDVDQIESQLLVLLDRTQADPDFPLIAEKLMKQNGGVTTCLMYRISQILESSNPRLGVGS